LIGWTGSQEDADFVALSPELDPQEKSCTDPDFDRVPGITRYAPA
jgi:hypothetical protein